MVKRLEMHIAEEGISNIRILPKRWEDLSPEEVGEHDLVIASYSLSFLDMREALLKMDRLAKRQVILYWFAGVPSWERIRVDLYPPDLWAGAHLPSYERCPIQLALQSRDLCGRAGAAGDWLLG